MQFKFKISDITFGLKIKTLIILAAGLFLTPDVEVQAQERTKAFQEIEVIFSYQHNSNRNYFHKYWESNPAYQIDFDTPFYAGNFFINGRFTSFTKRTEQVPDFTNIQVNAGWGMRYEIMQGLSIGGKTGVLFSMAFYEDLTNEQHDWAIENFGSTSPENETGILVGADILYEMSPVWGIKMDWSRNIVYTSTKMKLNYIGIGIYRALITPSWLQKILR